MVISASLANIWTFSASHLGQDADELESLESRSQTSGDASGVKKRMSKCVGWWCSVCTCIHASSLEGHRMLCRREHLLLHSAGSGRTLAHTHVITNTPDECYSTQCSLLNFHHARFPCVYLQYRCLLIYIEYVYVHTKSIYTRMCTWVFHHDIRNGLTCIYIHTLPRNLTISRQPTT